MKKITYKLVYKTNPRLQRPARIELWESEKALADYVEKMFCTERVEIISCVDATAEEIAAKVAHDRYQNAFVEK